MLRWNALILFANLGPSSTLVSIGKTGSLAQSALACEYWVPKMILGIHELVSASHRPYALNPASVPAAGCAKASRLISRRPRVAMLTHRSRDAVTTMAHNHDRSKADIPVFIYRSVTGRAAANLSGR